VGVERILAAAKQAGKKSRRRQQTIASAADVQQLYRFLQGGELGSPFRRAPRDNISFATSRTGWRFRRPEAGGGAFFEHGYPLVDLALWGRRFP